MKFSTEYKNIHFQITLEKESYTDISTFMGDKFNRLPNQTMIELKKGTLASYNLLITSSDLKTSEDVYTHYISGILLSSNDLEIEEEIAEYIEQEKIIETIIKTRLSYAVNPGPAWRK